jgi:hypothetical protein
MKKYAGIPIALCIATLLLFPGRARGESSFTLVVLPDTQCYCDTRHAQSAKKWGGDLRRYFFSQTRWIRDNVRKLNIAFVLHEGDITQTDYDDEWKIAAKAMALLDGKVPYCLCLGNHDIGYRKTGNSADSYSTANDRKTRFNKFFPRSKYQNLKHFGGTPGKGLDNSYWVFTAAKMNFLILALEFKPRDAILAWAGNVARKHQDHRIIVLTHSYLDAQNKRTRGGYAVDGNLGEGMWKKLVSKHPNIFLVLCGHVLGEGRLTSKGDAGNPVHQVLCDYQGLKDGGESWLRYMTFHPEKNRIEVFTYNPALNTFKKSPASRFALEYKMGQPVPKPPAKQ